MYEIHKKSYFLQRFYSYLQSLTSWCKDFQEETKKARQIPSLQEEEKAQLAGKKAFLEKDAHSKLTEGNSGNLKGNSGKQLGIFEK